MPNQNDRSKDFVFPLSHRVTLVNDFALRRDILELLPIPLALAIEGEWVWTNEMARGEGSGGDQAAGSFAAREMHPVRNLDGEVVGAVGWNGNAMPVEAINQLQTAVLVARDREVVWANQAAQRAFGTSDKSSWDDLYGFPLWEDVQSGVVARRHGEYRMRCLGIGPYVLVEAWRPELPDDLTSVPMEQVASLVHEIRNPLAALSGYVEMAQMEDGSGFGHYYAEIMHEIDRLSRLTSDLLSVSRPMTVNPDWVSLNDVVEHAWFAASRGRREGGIKAIRLKRRYPPEQRLWADPDRIQQVMANLVKNAVEAMQETGTYVAVDYQEADDQAVISVVDDGPGLPADLLGKLFVNRFTTKTSGNGFGLMIVRRIAEAHGGTVRVTSNGLTRIDILLPRAPKAQAPSR